MDIHFSTEDDIRIILQYDKHVTADILWELHKLKRVIVGSCSGEFCGWMRYNLFWDNTPFLNMLCVLQQYRGMGIGTKLVSFWEEHMQKNGYSLVITSTLACETAQHFYRKLHYTDAGCLLLPGETLEILFVKDFN